MPPSCWPPRCPLPGMPCGFQPRRSDTRAAASAAEHEHATFPRHSARWQLLHRRFTVHDGPQDQLVRGTWDSTAVLLEAGAAIESMAKKLPYVAGF